jgi:cell division protease FtsH
MTQQLPEDDRYHYSRGYLMTRIAVSLGGRAAEKEVLGEVSTGAQNDLKQVTDLAEKMVCQWGMSDKIGPVTFTRGEEHPFLGRKLATEKTFSEQMAWLIDQEIEKIVKKGEEAADRLIGLNRQALENLAAALLEEEVLDRHRIDDILKKSGVVKGAKAEDAGGDEPDVDAEVEA